MTGLSLKGINKTLLHSLFHWGSVLRQAPASHNSGRAGITTFWGNAIQLRSILTKTQNQIWLQSLRFHPLCHILLQLSSSPKRKLVYLLGDTDEVGSLLIITFSSKVKKKKKKKCLLVKKHTTQVNACYTYPNNVLINYHQTDSHGYVGKEWKHKQILELTNEDQKN